MSERYECAVKLGWKMGAIVRAEGSTKYLWYPESYAEMAGEQLVLFSGLVTIPIFTKKAEER